MYLFLLTMFQGAKENKNDNIIMNAFVSHIFCILPE